jgi:hypothetical protein
MNIDSYIIKSNSHKHCEDYLLSGFTDNLGYGIVSDGCGDERIYYTDIGSRILALSAKKILIHSGLSIEEIIQQNAENQVQGYDDIGKYHILPNYVGDIIKTADRIREDLYIYRHALSATLLYFIFDRKKNTVEIMMYGDGVVAWRKKENKIIEIHEVEFIDNIPFYPAIYLDKEQLQDYNNYYPNIHAKILNVWQINPELVPPELPVEVKNYHHSLPIRYSLDLGEIDILMIATDGITSLQNKETGFIESVGKIIPKIFDFKTYNGKFLERKMQNKIMKEYDPLDDLSIVALQNHSEIIL